MQDDIARERAVYQPLKSAKSLRPVGTPDRRARGWPGALRSADPFTNSLKLLRQARERPGKGLRAIEAGKIAESDEISLRNQ